jgi:hypothetical protein
MICALALATRTHPDAWWSTDDATLQTVIDLLGESNDDGR